MDNNNFNNGQNNWNYDQPGSNRPQPSGIRLKTDRSLGMYILLSLVTCGIYSIYFLSKVGDDINLTASRRDGKRTMHFCLVYFIFSWLTLGIYPLVWFHTLSNRIGDEARARGSATNFDASTFWLWYVLGSLIIVGPFIYLHKMCEALNGICINYNQNGY